MMIPVTHPCPGTAVFELRNVTFHYQRQMALNNLNLAVKPGRRMALLGANGSGKTTLLRLLDGLCFADQGTVWFRGEPLTEQRLLDDAFACVFRRGTGLVFQNPDVQLFSPTVFDEVAFGPLQLHWRPDDIRRHVAATLDDLEITHLKDRSPHQLSMGEKKRVAVASVLVLDPEILLLDEPTAALDPKSQGRMIDLLAGFEGSGKTIVAATHDLDHLEDIADECCVLLDGTAIAEGKPKEILADSDLLERAGLVHRHHHARGRGGARDFPHRHSHDR